MDVITYSIKKVQWGPKRVSAYFSLHNLPSTDHRRHMRLVLCCYCDPHVRRGRFVLHEQSAGFGYLTFPVFSKFLSGRLWDSSHHGLNWLLRFAPMAGTAIGRRGTKLREAPKLRSDPVP